MVAVLQLADVAIPRTFDRTSTSPSTGEPRSADCVGAVLGTSIVSTKISCRGLASAVQCWLQCVRQDGTNDRISTAWGI